MPGQIESRPRWRLRLTFLVLTTFGCTAGLQRQLDETRAELAEVKAQGARTAEELERLKSTLTIEINALWGKLECGNDRVKRFLSECERGSDTCSEDGVANALAFMDSQPHTTMYLRTQGPIQPVPFRLGNLGFLTEPRNYHPTTRFLVLVQPRAEGSEAEREAKRVGKDVVEYIRSEFKVPANIKIIGPLTLPCRLKADQLKSYMSRNDRPRLGEPSEKEGRLRVWTFRTDC